MIYTAIGTENGNLENVDEKSGLTIHLLSFMFSICTRLLCFMRCKLVLLVLGPNQLLLLIQHLSLFHAYRHSHSTFVLCSHALVDPFLPLIAHLMSKSCGYKAKLLAGQNQIFYLQYSLWIHSNWVKGLLCYFYFGLPQGKNCQTTYQLFPFAFSLPSLSSPFRFFFPLPFAIIKSCV